MPRPVLRTDRAEGVQLKNKTKHCTIILPGDNLSANITKNDVKVYHPGSGTFLVVQSARAVQNSAGCWFLIIKVKNVPRTTFGDSEEVEVTVTNPDTGETSDPPTEVEVVYYEEEPTRSARATAKATRRVGKAARKPAKKAKGKAAKATKKKKKR